MRRYSQKYDVELTPEELRKVESVIRNKDTTGTIKCRAQVLKLKNAGKLIQEQTAKQPGISIPAVNLAIRQYAAEGLKSVLHFRRARLRMMSGGKRTVPEKHGSWLRHALHRPIVVFTTDAVPAGKTCPEVSG